MVVYSLVRFFYHSVVAFWCFAFVDGDDVVLHLKQGVF